MKYYEKLLKRVGLETTGNYEKDGFRLQLWLDYQGLTFKQFYEMITSLKVNEEIEIIPLYSYGIELEGGLINDTPNDLERKIRDTFIIANSVEGDFGIDGEVEIARDIGRYAQGAYPYWRIGRDASVDVPNTRARVELCSPKLIGWGVFGFKQVETVFQVWSENNIKINKSCGGHIHVSAYGFYNRNGVDKRKVVKLWTIVYLLQDFYAYLVPPSRRDPNHNYCKKIRIEQLRELLSARNYRNINRYNWINFKNLNKPRKDATIEFRLWSSTTNLKKTKMHTLLSLKTVERALNWDKFYKDLKKLMETKEELTIEDFCDLLGIKGLHPVLEEVRNYIKERFAHFGGQNVSVDKIKQYIRDIKEEVVSYTMIARSLKKLTDLVEDQEEMERVEEETQEQEERRINENDDDVDVEERERTAAEILEELLSEGLLTMSA